MSDSTAINAAPAAAVEDKQPAASTAPETTTEPTVGDKRKADDVEAAAGDKEVEEKASSEDAKKDAEEETSAKKQKTSDEDAEPVAPKEDEVQLDVDESNIVTGKRQRKKVDYSSKEAQAVLDDAEKELGEDEDDEEAQPESPEDDEEEEAEESPAEGEDDEE